MGENSKIQWCHHSFNPWIGCQKVSAECDKCYASDNTFVRIQRKAGRELWGNQIRSERHITAEANWRKPLAWNAAAIEAGERHRVFCASLADVFEDRDELHEPRERLFQLIMDTPGLDWLLLTKRPENVMRMVPESWRGGFPGQVWLGTSAGTQAAADDRIPHLLRCPAAVRFLSCEPLLGAVKVLGHLMDGPNPGRCLNCGKGHGFTRCPNYGRIVRTDDEWGCTEFRRAQFAIGWVIAGGESGPGARPCDVAWLRSLRDQCQAAAVPFFLKQLGADPYFEVLRDDSPSAPPEARSGRWPGKLDWKEHGGPYPRGSAGPILRDRKGGDPLEWPEDLRVREFPGEEPVR